MLLCHKTIGYLSFYLGYRAVSKTDII